MNQKTIIPLLTLVIIVIGITFLFTSNILTFNISQINDIIELEGITFKIPTSYKYNTVCDLLGLSDEELIGFYFIGMGEIRSGTHNDNKHLIEFFKTDEIFSTMNLTPEMVFGKYNSSSGNILSPNYDPIFYDIQYWTPVIHDIMGVNPEVSDVIDIRSTDTERSYLVRLHTEKAKCQ